MPKIPTKSRRASLDAEALQLSLAGRSATQIQEAQGCALQTVHNRLARAQKALMPDDAPDLVLQRRAHSESRLNQWVARLNLRVTRGTCEECGRSAAEDSDVVKMANVAATIEKRIADLNGLDEPKELLVGRKAEASMAELAGIFRQVTLDTLPLADAEKLLLRVQAKIDERNGVRPAAIPAEAQAVESGAEKPN